MDDFDVAPEKIIREVSSSAEVEKIEHARVLLVQIICWVWISLHDFPFEELSEAQLEHECSDSVADFLRLLHQCINFNSIHKLSAQDFFVRHVLNDLRCIVLFWGDNASIVVASLVFCLSRVIALIMELVARDPDQLLNVQSAWEHP